MAATRFLHTSDLHLGKRFGTLPEDVRHRLVEARHAVLDTLSQIAHREGVAHVLLAGDTFDTETPSDRVRVQALAAMGAAPHLTWWLLPGNHDSLRAEPLWDALRRDAPANVHVLDTSEPRALGQGVALLPAPWPHPAPGTDLTAPFGENATPESVLRVGLAHGATASFHHDADTSAMIPPDRAARAGLQYLALGDWHGALAIGDRTRYSGTPERDSFRHAGRGACLLVDLASGQPPQIQEIETGRFSWLSADVPLTPGLDPDAEITRLLPAASDRRDTLLRLVVTGRVSLAERGHVEAAWRRFAPEFAYAAADLDGLSTLASAGDLDAIATSGALRAAAEDLRSAAADGTLSQTERRHAARALDRLWSMLQDAP